MTKARRRILALVAVALLVVAAVLIWQWGWAGDKTDEVWERIQRTGEIRVAMEASFPPFETIEADQFVGYDVDLAVELARRLGVSHMTPVNIHFDGLYDAMQDGKCDVIISALPYERERTQDVEYSVPYFHAGQVLVIPNDSTIAGPEDLSGKVVAVELGSQGHYVTRQWTMQRGAPWDVVTTYSASEALDLLGVQGSDGSIGDGHIADGNIADAAIVDAVTAYTYLGEHPERMLRLVSEQLTDEPYVIAMSVGSDILLDKINRALAEMEADGFKLELMQRWFGYPNL